MNFEHDDQETDRQPVRKSRSQVKREMLALQELGERLVALSRDELQRMGLEQDLVDAVAEAGTLRTHEAKRRQMQYIGTLMRTVDPDPIRKRLEEISQTARQATDRFHRLEELRDRLVAGESGVLDELMETCPDLDLQHVRQLARNAARERDKGRPPKSGRALFRYLREVIGE